MQENRETMNNENTARALYGRGWYDLPAFAQEAAIDFVEDLGGFLCSAIVSGDAEDYAHENADAAVPVYRSELLALLADPATADAIFQAADELGGLSLDREAGDAVTRIVSVGVYGVLRDVFGSILNALEYDGATPWAAFGLDETAAEVAETLFPEWAGTVDDLIEAAPQLEVASI